MLYFLDLVIVSVIFSLLIFPFVIHLLFLMKKASRKSMSSSREKDIACVITCYKNIEMGLLAADSLSKQNYNNFHIYLIADGCDIPTSEIDKPKLTILQPANTLSSKVRSMKYATDNFIRDHDAVAIFDPDNLADRNFLKECNDYLSLGFRAVQGKRTAKNLDTQIACLDAMGEIYYNYMTKKVPFKLGSSSIIAGSGMVIERALFESFFEMPYIKENFNKVIPGEDKILHYHIVAKKERIAYNDNAIVYDEKISNAGMVQNQRARWINSYLLNLKNAGHLFIKGLGSLNINLFLSGIITLYPPLFLLILSAFLLSLLNLFYVGTFSVLITIAVAVFILNFLLVLAINKAHPKIWAALWSVPYFILNQVLALMNIRKSNKDFLTTRNERKVTLDEVLNNK